MIFVHEKSHNDFENFEESIDSSNFVDTVWKSAFVAFMYSGGLAASPTLALTTAVKQQGHYQKHYYATFV